MGKGPVIVIADAAGWGLIAAPSIVDWLVGTAKEFNIQVQLKASEGGTTDATAIYLTKEDEISESFAAQDAYWQMATFFNRTLQ